MAVPSAVEFERPFFSRRTTAEAITELANADRLVIFAGAGVTIDRTGLDWGGLVARLLADRNIGADEASRMLESLGPLRAASVAAELFGNLPGSAGSAEDPDGYSPRVAMAKVLQSVLYGPKDAAGGRSSSGIAELWLARRLAGLETLIVTTNYEEHLAYDLGVATKVFLASQQDGSTTALLVEEILAELENDPPVAYLHGRIGKNDRTDPADLPVLSERDYFEVGAESEERLARLFEGATVLVVGSSMTDKPLLNALFKTRSSTADGIRRYAFTPAGRSPDPRLLKWHERRFEHFGIEGIYFDFPSQIGQMLAEIRIALSARLDHRDYADEGYDRRLSRWWSEWHSQISTPEKEAALQAKDHDTVVSIAKEFQRLTNCQTETIKIEIWLRWNPGSSPEHRRLRLWASSYARYTDSNAARWVGISNDEVYVSARAFIEGRVVYARKEASPSDRWKTFIGIPIESQVGHPMVVGTLVIASTTDDNDSKLGSANRSWQQGAFTTILPKVVAICTRAAPASET